MSELSGLYAVWLREVLVFWREKSRIAASIFAPLLWLVIFGSGFGNRISFEGFDYQTFIFPGIVAMIILFRSIFYGIYIIWDKKIDFLKEVLAAPLSRSTIFFGKVLGGATDAMLQGVLILFLGYLFGIQLSIPVILLSLGLMFVLSLGLVAVGLTLGSFIESLEGFGLIGSFVNLPLFFLSGALYPLDDLPVWLSSLTSANPVTYAVDALRGLMLGTAKFSLAYNFSMLLLFAVIMIVVGTFAFKRMKL